MEIESVRSVETFGLQARIAGQHVDALYTPDIGLVIDIFAPNIVNLYESSTSWVTPEPTHRAILACFLDTLANATAVGSRARAEVLRAMEVLGA